MENVSRAAASNQDVVILSEEENASKEAAGNKDSAAEEPDDGPNEDPISNEGHTSADAPLKSLNTVKGYMVCPFHKPNYLSFFHSPPPMRRRTKLPEWLHHLLHRASDQSSIFVYIIDPVRYNSNRQNFLPAERPLLLYNPV